MPGPAKKSAASPYVTATDIYKYIQCPHWPYYERYASPAEKKLKRAQTPAEIARQEDGIAHEAETVAALFSGQEVKRVPETADLEKDFAQTLECMKKGAPLIYHGTLVSGEWAGRPDILARREGESDLGAWHYVPIDVKSTHDIEKYQKFQLAFYAALLERIQARAPSETAIYNSDRECLYFDPADIAEEFAGFMKDLETSIHGKKPELVLRKGCYDVGPWGNLCERSAKEADDIALLYNVNVTKLKTLRELGIRTIADAAEMDPLAFTGETKGLTLHSLDTIKLQAQALKSGSVIIRKPVELPAAEYEIHFDIESSPPHGIDYLYGLLIREPGKKDEYVRFVSRSSSEDAEGEMWRRFLAWLETLPPEYVVYHYSPYELTRLKTLENRHGTSHWLDLFRSHMVDLSIYVKHNVTFPLYFYGLKHVAKFLGFSWRGALVKSGGESVDQFAKFLETSDEAIIKAIIDYNEDDVRATAHLKDWLARYAREQMVYEKTYPWNV
ncbi:TM0106 family RecB-like putative nuclease [Candidatus Uhrbacteria bacterium]|nr:TM0106 family RecB-like putative nuclease [Candidatus Uhrbacteria bacterium]